MIINQNVLLSTILWYQIGGTAKFVIDVASKEDLFDALDFAKEKKLPVFVLGMGSNMLFPDEGWDGVIIRFVMQNDGQGVRLLENNIVESFAGEFLDSVIQFGFEARLIGLEWAGGLPGTVGAAIRGNVGAFGGEIKDSFVKAHCIKLLEDGSYEEIILSNEEMEFGYRTSKVKKDHLIVVSAQFQLKMATDEQLLTAREVYNANIYYRQARHPLEYPNCGSVFKNISVIDEVSKITEVWPDINEKVVKDWHGKVSMGYIIDRLGMKGFRVGNAKVSEKHQNFIVNLGGAKSDDVKTIITEIQKRMQEAFGFTPEVEIEIVK